MTDAADQEKSRPLFGPKAFHLNVKAAREQGFRIFQAWHSCGCCKVRMAFRSPTSVQRQFRNGIFADVVRDDMGNTYNAVNTGRGFTEIKRSGRSRAIPVLPVVLTYPPSQSEQVPS